MKLVEAGYVIDDMPDGEAALAKIERMGRIAYKSEDKIDNGWDWCERCDGQGFIDVKKGVDEVTEDCPACGGKKGAQVREPSSHKFVKMILQAERKAKMILAVDKLLDEVQRESMYSTLAHDDLRRALADKLVSNVVDYMRENPAHESVIEHCSATVIFTTNRGVTHELVRHRLVSFTQESTRFCDYDKGKFGGEISVINRTFWGKLSEDPSHNWTQYERLLEAQNVWLETLRHVEAGYKRLRQIGIPPEIARDVLPNALKADIGVTANFREWGHIFMMRDSKRAHPDMRQLMDPLHADFRRCIPVVFD